MNAQDLEQRARELLAEAFSDAGAFSAADTLLRTAYVTDYKNVVALRAIVAALRHQPAPVVDEWCSDYHCAGDCGMRGHGWQHSPVVDDARMARALEWMRELSKVDTQGASEHLPAIEEAVATYDPNCGARTVRLDDALRKDAERYRWLRMCDANQEDAVMIRGDCYDRDELLSGAELDAAIDAAMKDANT